MGQGHLPRGDLSHNSLGGSCSQHRASISHHPWGGRTPLPKLGRTAYAAPDPTVLINPFQATASLPSV